MDTHWRTYRDRGRLAPRAAAALAAAALTLVFGIGAVQAAGCRQEEQRYAAQEASSSLNPQANGHRHGPHVRYMDYRDRSVPLLVW
jgi:hypothetical protein